MTTPPTTPPPPTNPVSLDDLLMGYMTVGAGTYTVNAGMTRDVGHATFSCPAGGAACRITVAADGTVTSVGGRATAMPSPAARTAKMAADEAARQAEAAAQKKTDAINMAIRNRLIFAAEQTTFVTDTFQAIESTRVVTTPETWNAAYTPLPGIAVGRAWDKSVGSAKPFVNPTVPSPLGDTLGQDDEGVANTIEFRKQGMNTRLGAFTGEVHKRTMKDGNKTTTDEIMIYHDKQASGSVKYSEYYSLNSTVDSRTSEITGLASFGANNGRLGVVGVNHVGNANGRLGIKGHATNFLSAAETALFSAPNNNLPSANDQTFTYSAAANTKPLTFPGTFHGVAGQYACTVASCTIARDSTGEKLRFGPNWAFTPTEKANEIMLPGLDHDTDYLVFGTWLQTVDQPGRDTTYKFGLIQSGSKPFGNDVGFGSNNAQNDQIAALRGKATYTGSAAGRYGLRVLDQNGSVRSSSTGSFTAKTTLMAQFGDTSGNVSVNDVYSIKGMITDFTDPQSPGTDLSAWSVELRRLKFGHVTGAPASLVGNEASVFPLGGEVANSGNIQTAQGKTGTTPGPSPGAWAGRFYGPAAAAGAGSTAAEKAGTYPTGVSGSFRSSFPNGDAIGAFGATLKE